MLPIPAPPRWPGAGMLLRREGSQYPVWPGPLQAHGCSVDSASSDPCGSVNHGIRVTAAIGVGHLPRGIAVNPRTNTIYAANNISFPVSVIRGRTDKVTGTTRGCARYIWASSLAFCRSNSSSVRAPPSRSCASLAI